jgi:malate permease and related proteins
LALALGSFMVMMLITFTFGLWIISNKGQGNKEQIKMLLQQPVIYAMLISVVVLVTDAQLPKWLGNTLDLLGGITIPLMTIALGVSLAKLKVNSWKRSFFVSCLRIFGGLAIGWCVCELMDLQSTERSIVLLQSAMPVAVFNFMLAARFNGDTEEAAAMVVVSTLLSFVSLPFLLMWIL